MFKTRRDVDRHVSQILGRIRDEKEKNSRGYQIARLYYDIAEYETAKRYLAAFLSVRENIPQAHKLMGQILEATMEKQKAVASYKRSLELDDKQKDLVLKICELYCTVETEPERAKYWADRAEKIFPNNQTIFKLKEKLVTMESSGNIEELEELITSELVKNPTDVQLRNKLLRLYLATGQDNDAYNQGVSTEKLLAFCNCLDWYECLVQVHQAYQKTYTCKSDIGFYTEKLSALANLAYLRLKEKDIYDCVDALHQLDVALWEALQIDKVQPEWQAFVDETQGRFYFLIGCLLFKRAQNGQLCWRDATSLAAICFLHSNNFKPLDTKTTWYVQADQHKKKFYDHLQKVGFYRLSQGGHLFLSTPQGDSALWAQELGQQLCTPQGKDKMFDTVFTLREMRNAKDRSYLIRSNIFTTSALSCPTKVHMSSYDLVAHMLYPEQLNEIVWLCLHKYCGKETQPDYGIHIFDNLQYSVAVLNNATPESLCQLDIQGFLYATMFCAEREIEEKHKMSRPDIHQPFLLPCSLNKHLCSQEQIEWWMAVYTFFVGTAGENFARLRVVLRRGIETIRLIGHHGISVALIIHLASTFDERAKEMKTHCSDGKGSTSKQEALEKRAAFYWGEAMVILERIEKNLTVRMPKERLFPDKEMDLTPAYVKELTEKAKFSLALLAIREGRYEDALKGFEKLHDPWASYHTAQVYQHLADNDTVMDINRSTSFADTSNQQIIMLMKARDALYLTVDRLRGNKNHDLNDVVSREIDDVVARVTCLESGDGFVESISGLSLVTAPEDPNDVTHQDTPIMYSTPAIKMKTPSRTQLSMTEHSLARPSPERLDLQIKALELSQQTLMKLVMEKSERSEELIRMNRELMTGLRESWDVIKEIREHLKHCVPGPQFPPYQPPPTNGSFMMNSSYRPTQQLNYPTNPGWMPAQYGYQIPTTPANGTPSTMPVYSIPPAQLPTEPAQQHPHIGKIAVSHDRTTNNSDNDDDDIYYVDGEYYEDNSMPPPQHQVFVPDSQLVQEWPFGHRAGLEGKSTVTYAPQTASQSNPGYFLSALKGQSLQYGCQQATPPMPGPGFFSSPSKQSPSYMGYTASEAQAPPSALATALSTVANQKPEMTMMPPNAVVCSSITTKPNLLTGTCATANTSHPSIMSPFQISVPSSTTSQQLVSLLSASAGPICSPGTNLSQPQKPVTTIPVQITEPICSPAVSLSHPQKQETMVPVQPPALTQDKPKVVTTPKPPLVPSATPTLKEPSSAAGPALSVSTSMQGTEDSAVGFRTLFSEKGEILLSLKNHPSVVIQVLYSSKEGEGKIIMSLLAKPEKVYSFDVRTVKLKPFFLPNTVSWTGNNLVSNTTEVTTIRLENVTLVEQFKRAVEDANRYTNAVEAVKGNLAQTTPDSSSPSQVAQEMPASALLSALATKPNNKEDLQEGQNNVFGGFTFSKQPDVQENEIKKDRPKPILTQSKGPESTSSTVNPFSSFSFKMPNSPGQDLTISCGAGDSSVMPAQPNSAFVLGENSASMMASFSSLAAAASDQATFVGTNDSKGFVGAGQKLFRDPSSVKSPCKEDEVQDEYEPNVDFKPVVPLPDLIDIKTGEEDEEKLFCARARLFRFDTEVNQWKERGIGEMKILKHRSTGRFRILMRREQVLKLCANHHLTKDLKLAQMPSSDKAWCWSAMDFAEEEMKMEQLSVRFKNQDLAFEFKKVFEKCQAMLTDEPEAQSSNAPDKTEVGKDVAKPSLASLFKSSVGSWTCDACYCKNDPSVEKCPACMTPKPSTAPKEQKLPSTKPTPSTLPIPSKKAEPKQSLASLFKSSPGSWTCDACYCKNDPSVEKCPACMTPKPSTAPKEQKLPSTKPTPSTLPIPSKKAEPKQSLASLFTPKAGSWTCNGCLCQNTGSQTQCPACLILKPGVKPEQASTGQLGAGATGFGSGQKSNSEKGFNFGSGGFKFVSDSSVGSASPFSFGKVDVANNAATDEDSGKNNGSTAAGDSKSTFGAPGSGFQFGTPTKGFTFGMPSSDGQSKETLSEKSDADLTSKASIFGAGAASPQGFAFSLEKQDSAKTQSPGFQFKLDKTVPTPQSKQEATKPQSGSPFAFTFNMTPGAKSSGTPAITSPKSPEVDEHGHYVTKEGDDSHIYFEPVVQLPDKVEIKSGEENETVLYEHRAKLYRFQDGEWKERGLGDVKILENADSGQIRILMRREQILKLCCNHYIVEEMEMKEMPNSNGKAWVWHAMDFSDGVQKHEQLSIRFKTPEIADDFKTAFDKAKESLSYEESKPVIKSSDDIQCNTISSSIGESLDNSDDVVFLFAEMPSQSLLEKANKFQLPDSFYLYENKPPCPGCRGCEDEECKAVVSSTVKETDALSEDRQLLSDQENKDTRTDAMPLFDHEKKAEFASVSLFGERGSTFSFSDLAAKSTSDSQPSTFTKDPSKPFSWSGAGKQLFGSSGRARETGEDDGEVAPSQEVHFEPVVPLPDLVEVKTGEEEEDPIFSHRAKLFRFAEDTNQWKEKGIGEMKILKNRNTGRYRLLLRREQVFKLACNHLLTVDMELKTLSTSETSWCWIAQDYSGNEAKVEKLAVKFKTIDLAKQFKVRFEECQEETRQMISQSCSSPLPEQAETSLLPTLLKLDKETEGGQEEEDDGEEEEDDDGEEEQQEEEEDDDDGEEQQEDDDDDGGEEDRPEEDEEDYEDQDEENILFEKRIAFSTKDSNKWKNLGLGLLKVIYDEDVNANRVMMELDEDEEIVCNHLIAVETSVQCDKKKKLCKWSPIDFSTDEPVRRSFRAKFSSVSALDEFEDHISQGRQLALDSEISEKDCIAEAHEIVVPEVVSLGHDIDPNPAGADGNGQIGMGEQQQLVGTCSPALTALLTECLDEK